MAGGGRSDGEHIMRSVTTTIGEALRALESHAERSVKRLARDAYAGVWRLK